MTGGAVTKMRSLVAADLATVRSGKWAVLSQRLETDAILAVEFKCGLMDMLRAAPNRTAADILEEVGFALVEPMMWAALPDRLKSVLRDFGPDRKKMN